MNEEKWMEFTKKAVPELGKISELAREYGFDILCASFSADGYTDCFHINDGVHYGLTKYDDDDMDYTVNINQMQVCKIQKELQ